MTISSIETVNKILQAYEDEGWIENAPHQRCPRAPAVGVDEILVAAVTVNPFQ